MLPHLHDEGMPSSALSRPIMTGSSRQRWDELLDSLVGLLPAGPASVLVDGDGDQPAILASRLAAALSIADHSCYRLPGAEHGTTAPDAARPCISATTIRLADGARWRQVRRWDVVIWLRTPPGPRRPPDADGEAGADIVVDLHDPCWPVIRRVAAPLADRGPWYLTETRAFFACRAATWDAKFGDDLHAYTAAITEAGIPGNGVVVVDVGCGTGRALAALRQAAGPHGKVIAIDVTPEMLRQARSRASAADAALILADARQLPLADACADAVLAAGLIMHLPDPGAGLRQLARITRPGGLLILFHPSGRAALAARHGRTLTPGEPLDLAALQRSTQNAGWQLTTYDDAPHRFLAIAARQHL
jgi:SAM-dependent methyltransferase